MGSAELEYNAFPDRTDLILRHIELVHLGLICQRCMQKFRMMSPNESSLVGRRVRLLEREQS